MVCGAAVPAIFATAMYLTFEEVTCMTNEWMLIHEFVLLFQHPLSLVFLNALAQFPIHSATQSLMHSLDHSFRPALICAFCPSVSTPSFIHLFTLLPHTALHSLMHFYFLHSCCHLISCSLIHSFAHPCYILSLDQSHKQSVK